MPRHELDGARRSRAALIWSVTAFVLSATALALVGAEHLGLVPPARAVIVLQTVQPTPTPTPWPWP